MVAMRVLLADDQFEVRSALRLLLEQAHGLSVVAEAATAQSLLDQARETNPDLVLLDWELPGRHAGDLVDDLRAISPSTAVIALSGRPEALRSSLDAGADAFVSKTQPPEDLVQALFDVCGGDLDS